MAISKNFNSRAHRLSRRHCQALLAALPSLAWFSGCGGFAAVTDRPESGGFFAALCRSESEGREAKSGYPVKELVS